MQPVADLLLPAKTIKKWVKVNEIESLKTGKKSPGIILEKPWNFVFMFLYEPCITQENMSPGSVTRSEAKGAVQPQNVSRGAKFQIKKVEE